MVMEPTDNKTASQTALECAYAQIDSQMEETNVNVIQMVKTMLVVLAFNQQLQANDAKELKNQEKAEKKVVIELLCDSYRGNKIRGIKLIGATIQSAMLPLGGYNMRYGENDNLTSLYNLLSTGGQGITQYGTAFDSFNTAEQTEYNSAKEVITGNIGTLGSDIRETQQRVSQLMSDLAAVQQTASRATSDMLR